MTEQDRARLVEVMARARSGGCYDYLRKPGECYPRDCFTGRCKVAKEVGEEIAAAERAGFKIEGPK